MKTKSDKEWKIRLNFLYQTIQMNEHDSHFCSSSHHTDQTRSLFPFLDPKSHLQLLLLLSLCKFEEANRIEPPPSKALISSRVTRRTESRNLQVKSSCLSSGYRKSNLAVIMAFWHFLFWWETFSTLGKLKLTRKLELKLNSVQVKLGSRGWSPWLKPTRLDPIRALLGTPFPS